MKCRVKCTYLTDSPKNSFIPSKKFKDIPYKKLWVEVNRKRNPPIEILSLDSTDHLLGLDGMHIHLTIDTHSCYLVQWDILSIDEYYMIINELVEIN